MPVKRAAPSWTGLSTAPHGWMTQTLSAGATGCAAGRASCACSRSAPSMCWVKGSTRCKGSYAGPSSSRAHRARSFATSSTSFRELPQKAKQPLAQAGVGEVWRRAGDAWTTALLDLVEIAEIGHLGRQSERADTEQEANHV